MICKHECPICGQEYQHLCHTPPKEPIGLILVLANSIEYMPPCDKIHYLLECNNCRYKMEKHR